MLACSTPRTIGCAVQLLTTSMTGTVSPMVDSTDPRKILIERCIWFANAARVAPIASGVATRTRNHDTAQGLRRVQGLGKVIDGMGQLLGQVDDRQYVESEQHDVVGQRMATRRLFLMPLRPIHIAHSEIAAMPSGLDGQEDYVETDRINASVHCWWRDSVGPAVVTV